MIRFAPPLLLALANIHIAFGDPGAVPKERPAIRPASALNGWADWERGKKIFEKVKVPPAPPLTPDEQLKTFKLAPGYRVELVASDPMIANPVFFEFDEDGRIWVLEYRGYMRDLQGSGEADPSCRMVVLEDTDQDGKADKSTVYLDKLVMPRSFAFVEGGVLLAEPPHLWYCRDTDGDLICDDKKKVGTYGFAGNPQHTANGLRRGIDNWLHNADWPKRHRFKDGVLIEEPALHRGQFGVSFDDLGRFYSCHESTAAVMDYLPEEYIRRNPKVLSLYRKGGNRERFGVGIKISGAAQEVFPIRPTPGITLGGLELRDDGTLRTYTIASGTSVYRGHQFPEDARGNLFVPEAGGHLIGRLRLEGDLKPQAKRFYPVNQELLASTDERFRPINARTGPDGALYIADLYKGVIEHVIFMVPWISDQVKARNLEAGNDRGRIWRIVSNKIPISRRSPQLAKAPLQELVKTLGHPNGWHRDTAQRLLVDRKPQDAVPLLEDFARRSPSHLGRMHALWTLDGMEFLRWETARTALGDGHPWVRLTALRVLEHLVNEARQGEFSGALRQLVEKERDPLVQQQALLSLGHSNSSALTTSLYAELLRVRSDALGRTAALTGMAGKEVEILRQLLNTKARSEPIEQLIIDLTVLISGEGDPERIRLLLDLVGAKKIPRPLQRKIVDGILNAEVPGRAIELEGEPPIVTAFTQSDDEGDNQRAMGLRKIARWPGNTPWEAAKVDLKPLSAEQATLAKEGAQTYARYCASCHQPYGQGSAGVAPPLARSEWVNGSPERLTKIVLHGMVGPIKVRDQDWNLHMPGLGLSGALGDRDVAGVLTFIRRAWGNEAEPVAPGFVAAQRKSAAGRSFPWTAAELGGTKSQGKVFNPNAKGEIALPAKHAQIFAQKLRYHPNLDVIGPWVIQNDAALWELSVPEAGIYRVHLLHAMDDKNAGNSWLIETDLSQLKGKVESTGSFNKFVEREVGTLKLKAGDNRLLMRPAAELKGELIDLRAIRLARE